MQSTFELTPKQAEFIKNAHHRWNVACGAVRSGKSYLQISYLIPMRLLERKGKRGLIVFLGATRTNIERNILQPLRDIYGNEAATDISSKNFAKVFGVKVYCIGADNIRQVSKIRGSEISYCAIDEATDINKEVFEMLKSRLSLPWSCCDLTTNPASPNHWFKAFLDSKDQGVDIYQQDYTIYDNPFLPEDYVKSLEAEYAGSIWFDRYILGKWTLAEGLIYPMWQNAIEKAPPEVAESYVMSIDYGTQNPFSAGLWGKYDNTWYRVSEYYHDGRKTNNQKTDNEYAADINSFLDHYANRFNDQNLRIARERLSYLKTIIDPSAASFIVLMRKQDHKYKVIPADNAVEDGIREMAVAIQTDLIKIDPSCTNWINEVQGYRWDPDSLTDKPIKESDHSMDETRYFVKTMRVSRPKSQYRSIFM